MMGFECLRLVTDLSPYSIQLLLSFLFVVLGIEPRVLQCARQVLYHGATIPSTAWFFWAWVAHTSNTSTWEVAAGSSGV